MTRAEQVLDLADRLAQLKDEVAELGLAATTGIHHIDRAVFDELPGSESSFYHAGHFVWTKEHAGIVIYCDESPAEPADRAVYEAEKTAFIERYGRRY